jgi:hypothetical protein
MTLGRRAGNCYYVVQAPIKGETQWIVARVQRLAVIWRPRPGAGEIRCQTETEAATRLLALVEADLPAHPVPYTDSTIRERARAALAEGMR